MKRTRLLYAERRLPWNDIALHCTVRKGSDLYVVGTPALNKLDPKDDGRYQEPFLSMSHEEASQLMDELWRAGVRPSNGDGSTGQVAAIKAHLEDMRTLVFKHQQSTTPL